MRNYYHRTYYHRYHRHHFHLFTGIVTIVLIMVLALVGLGAYQNRSFPFNKGSVSNDSSQALRPVNKSSVQTTRKASKGFHTHNQSHNNKLIGNIINKQNVNIIGTFWKRTNNILGNNNGTNTSLTPFFVGDNSNNSYRSIKKWLRFVTKANAVNDTKVISIKPYDAVATNSSAIHYKVRYNFKIHDHSKHSYNHIQIYDWTATFNNAHQIKQMGSPRKPAKDYIE